MGSNMAEAHPVAFANVVKAKERGAKVIHVDPHYSRTSALANALEAISFSWARSFAICLSPGAISMIT
jgi:anaerobic selenocysteine-containing dehydrogenase